MLGTMVDLRKFLSGTSFPFRRHTEQTGRVAGLQPVRTGDPGPAQGHPGPRPLRDPRPLPARGRRRHAFRTAAAADAAGAPRGALVLRGLRQVQLCRPQGGPAPLPLTPASCR